MERYGETTNTQLPVDGSLPPGLSGHYLCIEPDPHGAQRVHAVDLTSADAISHRHQVDFSRAAGGSPNVNLIAFADRILALGDGAIAHELTTGLQTRPVDLAGHRRGIGAYPKWHPPTEELHLISSPAAMTTMHHVISAGGMTRATDAITDAPAPVLDVAITTERLILVADGFVGLTHRTDHSTLWLPTRRLGAGRIVNAFDVDDGVTMDVVGDGLERWTMTPSAAAPDHRVLDITREAPPRFNEQFTGSPYRYVYSCSEPDTTGDGTTLLKHDLITGIREHHTFRVGQQAGEFLFAADPARRADEDGGWLLGVVHDHAAERTSLVVLDAADIVSPPLALIHLPRRILLGGRGVWRPRPPDDRAQPATAGLEEDTTTTLVGEERASARAHARATTSIAVRGLTKRFGDVLAVDDLSFDVAEGTVTGFLGPNGAGKTTTLRMLLGLVTPTSGTATIAGRSYGELDAPFHHVGAVLEATSFHPGRRAQDHLRVLAIAAGLPVLRVPEVLEQVGLGAAADRRVKGFSLGMRQRLGLAAALLGDPAVLILDEPANGLDPEGVHWLRQFLRSYADRGRTVLVSSHLLAEVAQTVDNVVIIAGGRLIRQSSLRELANEATPGVWVRTPQADALRDTLVAQGIATQLTSPDTVEARDTTTETVGELAARGGIVIFEMTTQHFDLEQYFLSLTNPERALP